MIFQDWSYKGNNFHDKIMHDPIHIGDCKYVNREDVILGGFFENSHYWDWAATLGPIRPPPEPPPWDNMFLSLSSFSCIYAFYSYIKDNTWDRCGGGFTNILTQVGLLTKLFLLKNFLKKQYFDLFLQVIKLILRDRKIIIRIS